MFHHKIFINRINSSITWCRTFDKFERYWNITFLYSRGYVRHHLKVNFFSKKKKNAFQKLLETKFLILFHNRWHTHFVGIRAITMSKSLLNVNLFYTKAGPKVAFMIPIFTKMQFQSWEQITSCLGVLDYSVRILNFDFIP